MIHDYVHFSLPLRHAREMSERLSDYLERGGHGRMLGCFQVDVGSLNTVVLLRGYDDDAEYLADRRRLTMEDDPFGCCDLLLGYRLDSYVPFGWIDPVPEGAFGPWYEIRTYDQRLGGMPVLSAAWQKKLPARAELSPVLTAGMSLDGLPRFTHLWPYAGLDERARIRAEATASGAWPPNAFPGSPPTRMRNMICTPLPCSPLQ